MPTNWFCLPFSDLSTQQLHDVLKLRMDVFVVEQNCAFAEIDGYDTLDDVQHLLGYQNGHIIAYARLLPAGVKYNIPSIGRVVTHAKYRKDGLGHQLMKTANLRARNLWPDRDIFLQAQQHLEQFYMSHGFKTCSEVYMEDDIPHVDMIKKAS